MLSPRLIVFLVLRSWRGNPWRTALSVLGIALGIAVVTAIHVMDHNTIQSRLRQRAAQTGRMDFELSALEPDREPREVLAGLRRRQQVRAAGVVWSAPVRVGAAGDADGRPSVLFGLAPFPDDAFAQYAVLDTGPRVVAGELPGVLVGPAWAAERGVAPGDVLQLGALPRAARPRCIDGELQGGGRGADAPEIERAVRVLGVLADQRLGARRQGLALVGPLALARELAPSGAPLYQVSCAYGVDSDQARAALATEFLVRDESAALIGESSDERAFRNGVKLLGGLALMLGMFVVFQTLSQSLVERLRQIGLLRCLGTSGGNIAAVFLVDALAMALCGALVGLALGLLLALLLQSLHFSSLGMLQSWELREIPLRPLAWTVLLGLVFTLAGAAFPLWRARSLPTIRILHARGLSRAADVLRGVNGFLFGLLVVVLPIGYLSMTTILSDSERETQVVLLQLGGLLLVFGGVLLLAPQLVRAVGAVALWPLRPLARLPVHLVGKALRRQTGRFAASVCGLGIVLLAGIALESLTTALHGQARQFGRAAMHDTLFIGGGPVEADDAAALIELDGIDGVEVLRGPVDAPFRVAGLDTASIAARLGDRFADPEVVRQFETRRSLVVSSRLARLQELSEGDAVALLTDGGPVAYTVLRIDDRAGFVPDDPAWALAHPRWMRQDFCLEDDAIEHVVLRLSAGANPTLVRRAVRARLPALDRARSGASFVAYLLRDVTRDFRLFQVLLLLILGLAAMGVVNAMTIAALGRAREIGVLRALGADRRQLRLAFLIEGALIGLVAAGVALALGVPLGRLVVRGMNEVAGLDAPYLVPTHVLWLVPVAAVGIGTLASLLPGNRAARISPARAVRFE